MVQTWDTGDATEVPCKICETVYERRIKRYPVRDRDEFRCEVCGTLIQAWNDTACPQYNLAKALDADAIRTAYCVTLDHAKVAYDRYRDSKGGPDEGSNRKDLDDALAALGRIADKA